MRHAYGGPVAETGRATGWRVSKVKVDTDLRGGMRGESRKIAAENPAEFDPRKFLKPAMDAMRDLCRDRFERFGTAGHALKIKVIGLDDMAKRYAAGKLDPQIAAAQAA